MKVRYSLLVLAAFAAGCGDQTTQPVAAPAAQHQAPQAGPSFSIQPQPAIVLASGEGAAATPSGIQDANTIVTACTSSVYGCPNGTAAWKVYGHAGFGAWGTDLPGAQWINILPENLTDGSAGNPSCCTEATFTRTFQLPANVVSPSLSITVKGDNAAEVLVNGHVLGAQNCFDALVDLSTWNSCSQSLNTFINFNQSNTYTAPSADLAAGTNTIQVVMRDAGGAIGIQYLATVNYSEQIDDTPPLVNAVVTALTGTKNGDWYTGDVKVHWDVSDPDSPVTSAPCPDVTITANTTADGQTVSCSATSQGGTNPQSVIIKRDATVPTVSGAVTSGTQGNNGWYTSPVGVTWTASQAGPSGQTMSSDCSETSFAADTPSHTFTCTVTTGAGLSSAQGTVTVKIDGTKPVVSYSAHPASYTVDQMVDITCSATDAAPSSGMASNTCQPISGAAYSFAIGNNPFSATATDNAGNQGTGSTAFTVQVTSGSLCALTTAWVTQPGKGGGIVNSLCVKLQHGDTGAYINEVGAQSGKAIAADKAAILIGLAKQM